MLLSVPQMESMIRGNVTELRTSHKCGSHAAPPAPGNLILPGTSVRYCDRVKIKSQGGLAALEK